MLKGVPEKGVLYHVEGIGLLFFVMERIYTEATISKSLKEGLWEEDENGNPIIIIEASNDNLDYQEERVLRSALMRKKDYFLKNGVISYDHKHLPNPDNYKFDPDWNEEKYILGKPLDAWEGTDKHGKPVVKVRAVLSKSNSRAAEIIKKLKDKIGTIKASVGGRRPQKMMMPDPETMKDVATIIDVDWDEVALTYKPVNQTLGPTILSPKEFVKALTAGSSADPSNMTGGNALQMQSTEREPVFSLLEGIQKGCINTSDKAIDHLVKGGFSSEKASKTLKVLINKKIIGDIMSAEKDAAIDPEVVVEEATDDLLKALKDLEDDGMSKAKKDGDYKMKGGHMYMKKADGKYEKMEEDSPDYNGEDEEEEEGKEDDVKKSLPETKEEDFYDATEDLAALRKSVKDLSAQNKEIVSMLKSMDKTQGVQSLVLKAIGSQNIEDSTMLKAIHDAPQPRNASVRNLKTMERFEKSVQENISKVTQPMLSKSMADNKVDANIAADANLLYRKGGAVAVATKYPGIIKNIVSGKE